jgi:hypothetical protein
MTVKGWSDNADAWLRLNGCMRVNLFLEQTTVILSLHAAKAPQREPQEQLRSYKGSRKGAPPRTNQCDDNLPAHPHL